MTRTWKWTYMKAIQPRYQRSSREQKKTILDEFCHTYRCHRKSAIRLLNGPEPGDTPPRHGGGRRRQYGPELIKILEGVWEATHYLWSARLKAALPVWMPYIRQRFALTSAQETQLRRISPATIDRHLAPLKRRLKRRIYGTTKPGTLLKHMIPIQTVAWEVRQPGYLEIDLVSHSGSSAEGFFAYTLDATDLDTTWVERRAVLGKGQLHVVQAMEDLERALPFRLRGIDADNGSEFINDHLWRWCRERKIRFTRGRPCKKDDNAHIEQKNWTHVRKLIGYERYDTEEAVALMNDLYTHELRYFQNVFQPSVKLIKKVRKGARLVRLYDIPRTPWQRVLLSPHADPGKMKELQHAIVRLDPFELSEAIDSKLSALRALAAKGPFPAPRNRSWGRVRWGQMGTRDRIPTSTLGDWYSGNDHPVQKVREIHQKEVLLQTS